MEEHFSFRLVVEFPELNNRVIPHLYPRPPPKEMAFRIGTENKKFKTVLDFRFVFGSMSFYKDHSKYMAVITPFGVSNPTRLEFGAKNGPGKMQRIADH